ncbi:Uncharacterised protein [Klebsiella pneumoniae]|nr:Uncharacterised protein [Klebsiella pneumoniae]
MSVTTAGRFWSMSSSSRIRRLPVCRWPQLYTEMLDSSISGLQRPLAQKRRTWPSPSTLSRFM